MALNVPKPAKRVEQFIERAEAPAEGSMVVTFTADRDFVAQFDRLRKKRGVSRAALIKMAMAAAIAEAKRRGEL